MDNRILVAAARGARLVNNFPEVQDGLYEDTELRPNANARWYLTVHPDDTELLYCKVGRALRKAAVNPPCNLLDATDKFCDLLSYQVDHDDWLFYRYETDVEILRMFLLMMAEELSYEVLE